MDESLRAQIDAYLPHIESLIGRGRKLREALATDSSSEPALTATRAWQRDCGVAIHQLSGGSKAHWLARSFSEAFLVRATGGDAVESVAPSEIVERLVSVLDRAAASLAGFGDDPVGTTSFHSATTPHLFDFVHDVKLRPVLEQAYADSRDSMEKGCYGEALLTSCGILEAIVTDALDYKGAVALAAVGPPEGQIADWSFAKRLGVAERAGLIREGCARLPSVALSYRDLTTASGELEVAVSERDARIAGQVLRVIMRDLDPGR